MSDGLIQNERHYTVARNFVSPLGKSGETNREQLSVSEIWRTVRKRRTVIAAFALATFVAVAIYTYSKTPLYEGHARLEIDPDRSANLGLQDLLDERLGGGDISTRIQTEVRILQSDAVAMQVTRALGLAAKPDFAGAYTQSQRMDPERMTAALREHLLTAFRAGLTIQVIPNTEIVEIHFRNKDPQLATDIANAIIDEYVKRNFKTRYEGTLQVSQWLASQMEELKSGTTSAQLKLADFERQHNILGSDESDNIVTQRLKQLNEELTQAEAERIIKEARYRLARTGDPELIASIVPTPALQVLRTQEAELRAQYTQLTAKYGSGYPKLGETAQQLQTLEASLQAEIQNIATRLQNEYMAASDTEAMLRRRFEDQKEIAYKLNESVAQYAILRHEVESGQQLYDALQLKLKEAGITSGLASSYISVVDRAQTPARPVEPRKMLNLALGLVGGMFGGLMLGFVVDSVDDTVRTSEELEAVAHLPALGTVPIIAGAGEDPKKKLPSGPKGALGPISFRQPQSACAEAYRAVCSSILLCSIDLSPKVLAVVSAVSQEGKSTVSCNLAVVLAARGKKVLLVDADLRRSAIHSQLGVRRNRGLSSLLTRQVSESVIQNPLKELPTLAVLPAGLRPPQPAELLASERMRQLVESWKEEYDHVIIDTAPILPVADTLALAAQADAVVIVSRSGLSRRKAILRVKDILNRSGANILGVILNAVNMDLEYYYAYPSGYHKSYQSYLDDHATAVEGPL